ncbi:DedA family protein [Arsenophonus endosymbiont of Lipoptena cervi]|uniref:DedA family protein n=1 Tax=Arsenophonus endosymbiont of Lipoptena cervi TaxID=363258 RepID=UPI00376EA674
MKSTKELFFALWNQDHNILMNPSLALSIYIILFIILILENGILPAAFLPGDSLLILVGVLISKGVMNYPLTIIILTISSSLGYWIAYLQGKWLGDNKFVKYWLSNLPKHYQQQAYRLFHNYGLAALIIGRFLAFIRSILPIIAGLSGFPNKYFQFFNWISGLLWVFILTTLGYLFGNSLFFQYYEKKIMNILVLLPIILFFIGFIGTLIVIIKKKIKKS